MKNSKMFSGAQKYSFPRNEHNHMNLKSSFFGMKSLRSTNKDGGMAFSQGHLML